MARKKGKGAFYRNGKRKMPTTKAERESAKRETPNVFVQAKRALFSFVRPTEKDGPDGRVGEIDSDICDGIGQLQAVGLLDGHGIDGIDLRNAGRRYGSLYWQRNGDKAPSGQRLERGDRAAPSNTVVRADIDYDNCVEALRGMSYERNVLELLCCDYWFSDEIAHFAEALIAKALIERKILPGRPCTATAHHLDMLDALIRALATVHDALLPYPARRAA